MAQQQVSLNGNMRTASASNIRKAGSVPAVLYGHGLSSTNIEVNAKAFNKAFAAAGYSSLVNLKLEDGKEHTVLIRDIQFHPLKSHATHADFFQVRMDEAIEAQVPLKLVGESSAVKDLSGVLVRSLDELTISALPQDLPHDIEVDISVLTDFEKVIRVGDITLPSGVTGKHEADEVVVSVQAPRSEQEIEQLSEEVKEDVEAVEGVKKEEPVPEEGEAGTEAEAKKE